MNIFSSIYVVLIVMLLLISRTTYGQEATQFALPSPNAASLAQYGDIPVSEYTGLANISVPLYQSQIGDNPFEISISYYSQGIKVNEITSSVGQNWSLNAGGVITRTVRGKADELQNGFFDTGYSIRNHDSIQDFTTQELLDISNGTYDVNPDVFHFNFMGKSGKFIYNPTPNGGEFISIPFNDWKIEYNNSVYIDEWTITDDAGVIYYFNQKEESISYDKSDGTTVVATGPTAWYIKSVTYPNGKEITFDYTSPSLVVNYDELSYKEKVEFLLENNAQVSTSPSESNIQHKTDTIYLSKITTDKEEIIFYKDARCDHQYEKRYNSIEIKRDDSLQKKIVFGHSYWSNGPLYTDKRLRLDNVEIEGQTSTNPQTFHFEYLSGNLPSRDSYATDHWGYYNGQDTNNDILPAVKAPYPSGHPSSNLIDIPGANKEPDPSSADNGLLKKIIYPKGGYTEFEYEGNTYGYRSTEEVEVLSSPTTSYYEAVTDENGWINPDVVSEDFTVPSSQDTEISVYFEPIFNPSSNRLTPSSNYNDLSLKSGFGPNEPDTEYSDYDLLETDLRVRLSDENNVEIFNETLSITDDGIPPLPQPESFNFSVHLKQNITYTIEVEARGKNDRASVGIPISGQLATTQELKGGGNKIKKIKSHDGINSSNDKINTYYYNDFADSSRSSGAVIGNLQYYFWVNNTYLIRYSTSSSLIGPQGVHVGYKNVSVVAGENENKGYSKFVFNGIQDLPSYPPSYAPFEIVDTYAWDIGQILKREDYDGSGNLVQSEEFNYDFDTHYAIRGVLYKKTLSLLEYDPNFDYVHHNHSWMQFFDHTSANKKLINKKTKIFNSSTSNYLEFISDYEYNGLNHEMITNQIDTNSNGEERETVFEYAHEIYNNSGEMLERNMLSQPYSTTIKDGNGDVLKKEWTLWKDWGIDHWLPCGTWVWDGSMDGGEPKAPTSCSSN